MTENARAKSVQSRSPHGERGLKYESLGARWETHWSLPARGAWIEIVSMMSSIASNGVAPRTGSVD